MTSNNRDRADDLIFGRMVQIDDKIWTLDLAEAEAEQIEEAHGGAFEVAKRAATAAGRALGESVALRWLLESGRRCNCGPEEIRERMADASLQCDQFAGVAAFFARRRLGPGAGVLVSPEFPEWAAALRSSPEHE